MVNQPRSVSSCTCHTWHVVQDVLSTFTAKGNTEIALVPYCFYYPTSVIQDIQDIIHFRSSFHLARPELLAVAVLSISNLKGHSRQNRVFNPNLIHIVWTFSSGVSGKSCRCKQFCVIQYLLLKRKALCSRYRSLCPQRSPCPSESLFSPLLTLPLLICEFTWRGLSSLALLLNHAKKTSDITGFFLAAYNCVSVCVRLLVWVKHVINTLFDLREATKHHWRDHVIIWINQNLTTTYKLLNCTKFKFLFIFFHFWI